MIHLKEKPQGLWPRSGGLTLAGLIPVALADVYYQEATDRTYDVVFVRKKATK